MSNLCKIKGCGGKRTSRGWCQTHYVRWLKYGSPYINHRPIRKRGMSKREVGLFERKQSKILSNGCLVSTAWLDPNGYRPIKYKGKEMYLHRISLELFIGRSLQKGEQANHKCHNPACFNPHHLYIGDQAQNIRDAVERGTNPKGELHGRHYLTETDVLEIRKRGYAGESTEALRQVFGVSRGNVTAILTGRFWKHLLTEEDRKINIPSFARGKRAKLTVLQVKKIRRLYDSGKATVSELARRFGVQHGTIGPLVRRQTWKHV